MLITTPESALEMVHRAVLKPADLAGVLLLWPESWGASGERLLTELLQDVPKETQRIIVSSDPAIVGSLAERYAWRATITDLLGSPNDSRAGKILSAPVSWSGRLTAIKDAVEQLDPESVTVWVGWDFETRAIERILRETGISGVVTTEVPESAPLIICYDLPGTATLDALALAGPVLLLVPPGAERYAAWLAPTRKPVQLRGALHRAREKSDRLRGDILRVLESQTASGDVATLATLAPLFERHEATDVAAALFQLWQTSGGPGDAASPRRPDESPVKLWVSAGKRDSVTPSDLVGVLVRECEVPREAVGKVEIRDSFSLVEISPSAGPEQVAGRLTGKSIRKRRLVARLDRSSAPLVERVAKRLPRPKDRGRA